MEGRTLKTRKILPNTVLIG